MANTNITASAHVKNKNLYIMGLYKTPKGVIPFSHVCQCEAEDGPVNFSEDINPEIQAAIDNSQKQILTKIGSEKIRLAAEELVDRTRAGDQNAAAMMVMVKKNAEKGYPRAQLSLTLMTEYAKQKPSNTRINGESLGNTSITKALSNEIQTDDSTRITTALNGFLPGMSFMQTVVAFCNGPELTPERVKNLMLEYSDEEKRHFINGFKNWNRRNNCGDVGKIGKSLGYARAIQVARKPNTSIKVLGKRVESELD